MNKLSFGLLGFLCTEPQTGYDLMIRLNQFWHTNHSAIYPLLSELVDKGYVTYTVLEQKGKPDKKVYDITEEGLHILKEWIMSATDDALVKDEMMFKLYCIQILDKETVEKLLDELEQKAANDLDRYMKSLENFKGTLNKNLDLTNSAKFGAYLLIQKVIGDTKLRIKWCHWIRSLYREDGMANFFDSNFSDFLD